MFLWEGAVEQGALSFSKKQDDVSDDIILRCKDLRAAIRLCVEASGLHLKEIAFALGPQENHLSRMMSSDGDRHLPPELIDKLMDICGNEIPLRWQALKRNYGLHRLKTALEMENERLRQELEEERKERVAMLKVLKELKA